MSPSTPKDCVCQGSDYEFLDVFGMGNLTDLHMDPNLSEEELARRMQDAVDNAYAMGGQVSAGMLQELAVLSAPKMTWEDFIVLNLGNRREGIGKNDWGSPRLRSLASGLYLPKKKSIQFTALILIDRSGSVSNEQANYGLSQFQVLGESIHGYVVCFDTKPYYNQMTEISGGNQEELLKVQYVGGGGTTIASSLYTYEEELGPVDIVIIITDGAIFDLPDLVRRGIPNSQTEYLWLLTEHNDSFSPAFGRVFSLTT